MGNLVQANFNQPLTLTIAKGCTMEQIIEQSQVPESLLQFVVITVNGTQLTPDQWPTFVPRQNDRIGFWIRPAGSDGKQVLRLVALVAVAIAASYIAGPAGLNLVSTSTITVGGQAVTITTGLSTAGYAVAAGITIVGSLLINALVPLPTPNLPTGSSDQGESYFISGQANSARPYQIVPIAYGHIKMLANLATSPQIFSAGQSSLFTALYDFGLGTLEIGDIKAGDTRLEIFDGRQKTHIQEPKLFDVTDPTLGLKPVPLELVNYPLKSQDINIALTNNNDMGEAGTAPNTLSAVVELTFPQGIAYYDKNGNLQDLGVNFQGQYKKVGSETWLAWPEGTKGYARDHLSINVGNSDPGTPNENEPPNVTIQVPARVDPGQAEFEVIMTFDQEVFDVDPEEDLRFINAETGVENLRFILNRKRVISPNRSFGYRYQATVIEGQYYIETNLANYLDAPVPDGRPFPSVRYVSPNFIVGEANTGGGGDGGGGTDQPATSLYDRTEGNETYVEVRFRTYQVPPEPLGEGVQWQEYLDQLEYLAFVVWKNGVVVTTSTYGWESYAGVIQAYSITPAFVGDIVTHFYSLKNLDASPTDISTAIDVIGEPGLDDFDGSPFVDRFSVFGGATTPGKVSVVIPFPEEGDYEIRVIRIGDNENADNPNQYFDACYWTRIASRGYPYDPQTTDVAFNRKSILNLQRQHTMLELELEASDEISGNIQQITAEVRSLLRWHDGTRWQAPKPSSNPAWVVADILTGYSAQQIRVPYSLQDDCGYLRADQLDIQSFIDFAAVCDEEVEYEYRGETLTRRRYEFNGVIASENVLMETVQNILSMARAQLILGQNGLLQIMMDVDRGDQVRQVFTPSNSWGFAAARTFPEFPDALKISFTAPELGYQNGEIIIYKPESDPAQATVFESLKAYGCTNWHQAAWWGGYQWAQMLIRMESFTLNVMAESLVIQRGDVVEVATDVAKIGGGSHLIVDHPQPDVVVLSEAPYVYDDPYYTIRTNSGIIQGRVLDTDLFTVTLDKPIESTIYANESALIVIGQKDLVTKKYIVNSIRPKADLTAELTLVVYDERLYQTDDGVYPEWSPGGDGDPEDPNYGKYKVTNLTGFTYLDFPGEGFCRDPYSVSSLAWEVDPDDDKVAGFEIQWSRLGQTAVIGFDQVPGSTRKYEHRYQANSNEFGAGRYTVTPITSLGYRGIPMSVYINKSHDRIAPPMPNDFHVTSLSDQIRFYWKRPDAIDIGGYAIYVSLAPPFYDLTMPETATLLTTAGCKDEFLVLQGSWNQTVGAVNPILELGAVFWITAIDTSGNESLAAMYGGLANGPICPSLVEPFGIKYIVEPDSPVGLWGKGEWAEAEWSGGLVGGGGFFLYWEDLDDPYNEILYYDIRHTPEENADYLFSDVSGVQTQLDTVPQGVEQLNLTDLGMRDVSGTFFIRAVDKRMCGGPWNRTSLNERDINYTGHTLTQVIEYYAFNRAPYSRVNIAWSAEGAAVPDVAAWRATLYPRQLDPVRSGGIVLYEGSEMNFETTFDHLQQENQHYGYIVIEALFDSDPVIASENLVIDWAIELDEEPPPAVEDLTVTYEDPSRKETD